MPKDPTRNQPNYKIGGSHLNEFEYARDKGAMTEAEHERFQQQQAEAGDAAQAAPQTEAERVQQLMSDVHEQVQRRKEKQSASAAQPAGRKGGARKPGGQTSAKSADKASAGRKSAGAKKGAAQAGTKQGAGKQGGAKSAAGGAAARTAGRTAGKKGARKSAR
ncbi:MAG TPA: hypothetical protein VF525_08320 [Pyrinomonadaceae bacterium]|jgi:hypothetical protein